MSKEKVWTFFDILQKDNPNPEGELNYTNTYTMLVAVALSAQSTDIGVNKATEELFKIVKTPQDMLDLGLKNLIGHIKIIGLYNTKAKNVIKAAEMLVNDYAGIVPDTREDLVKLPGVGRKTANVVLNMAFGQPTIAIDTHIFRISNRTGLAPAKNVDQVERKLEKRIPSEFKLHAHHWLILLGRYICKARTPECDRCPVISVCNYKDKLK